MLSLGTKTVRGASIRSPVERQDRSRWGPALVGGMLALPGCVVVAHDAYRTQVSTPPPPPPAEETVVVCTAGHTRVPGAWRWNGFQYVWLAQHCVYRPGYEYRPGEYYSCGDGYCYRDGIWLSVGASFSGGVSTGNK